MALLVALLLLSTAFTAEATALGALKLDNYTFDKVLAMSGSNILVKFDSSFAYGEKEEEFKQLCKVAFPLAGFLVGEVPVQKYGNKENDDLQERFGLTEDDFPAYFLFNAANPKGLRYSGAVTVANLAAWLRKNQVRVPSIGTIEELDGLAKKFLKEGLAEEHLQAAKKLVEADYRNDRKAAVYVKLMQKIKERGEGFVASEIARISKLLDGQVAGEKKAELGDKLRILGAFSKDEL